MCRFCLAQDTLKLFAQVKDRRYYRCSNCNITLLDQSQFVSQDEEKKRYDEHINRPDDMGYRNFLRRLTDPLVSRLIALENSRTTAAPMPAGTAAGALPAGEENRTPLDADSVGQGATPTQAPGSPAGASEAAADAREKHALTGLDFGCGPCPVLTMIMGEMGFSMDYYDLFYFPKTEALERQYDFVTATEVVEHFCFPAKDFGRLCDLVKPGGYLAIMTSFLTPEAEKGFAQWYYRRDNTHVAFYKDSTFHQFAKRYGWKCEIPGKNVVIFRKPTV